MRCQHRSGVPPVKPSFEMPSVNPARLDLATLLLLMECAEQGSLTAAAARCNMSVMGASGRLRRLESALGRQLFFRYRRGLQATAAGHSAIPIAKLMVDAWRELVVEVAAAPPERPCRSANTGRAARIPAPHPANPSDQVAPAMS